MKLIIELSHTDRPYDLHRLVCNLEETPFKNKWLARYYAAKERNDKISEPWAFYNLNNDWNEKWVLAFLNQKIDICNEIWPDGDLFDRHIDDIKDQDTLNYLHAVFEETHGKLDAWMDNPHLNASPPALRESLSHINQTIHRCEGHEFDKKIRVVYFDLPKTKVYAPEDYELFTTRIDFGGVYVNYADVGKPLEELAIANDHYHHDIVPYLHYSVDFIVKFYDDDGVDQHRAEQEYIDNNHELLASKGYAPNDLCLTPGRIKIAQLEYKSQRSVLNELKHYNWIHDVIIE
jgi:hypothetical protein